MFIRLRLAAEALNALPLRVNDMGGAFEMVAALFL
jgi:hypothetical protein